MKTYQFEDFILDDDNETKIQDVQIWMSVFNPLVPSILREKALEELNDFIAMNKHILFNKTDTVGVVLEAYISREVEIKDKYKFLIFIWNEEEGLEKDYLVEVPILPIEKYFSEFKECIMQELENIIFG